MREEMIEVAEDMLVELNQVIVDMESEGLQTNYEQINRKIDVRLFCLKETFAMSVWVHFTESHISIRKAAIFSWNNNDQKIVLYTRSLKFAIFEWLRDRFYKFSLK